MIIRFLERYIFSHLPEYKKRREEMDEAISRAKISAESFMKYDRESRKFNHSEYTSFADYAKSFYENEILKSREFKELFKNYIEKYGIFYSRPEEILDHSYNRLLDEINMTFLKKLDIELSAERLPRYRTDIVEFDNGKIEIPRVVDSLSVGMSIDPMYLVFRIDA